MLDVNTFGKSQAAINLAKILIELQSEKVTGKVERYFSYHNQTIKTICDIKDRFQRNKLLKIYREHATTATTGAQLEIPPNVRTHMYNVLVGKIKREIEKL